jgi:hypothetical protein
MQACQRVVNLNKFLSQIAEGKVIVSLLARGAGVLKMASAQQKQSSSLTVLR